MALTEDIVLAEGSGRVCYILLPEGLKDDGRAWMESAAAKYGVNVVALSGMDWNDSLTPWSAAGVFRKAKPFGGNAAGFLTELGGRIFPDIEARIGLGQPAERCLAGISLSGLFALWAAFSSDLFTGIASISGSLWYDGFAEWTKGRTLSPAVKRIFISLGDREKNSKDKRMATVETMTREVVDTLRTKGATPEFLLEADTTHFSPLVPRLEKAFDSLYGKS